MTSGDDNNSSADGQPEQQPETPVYEITFITGNAAPMLQTKGLKKGGLRSVAASPNQADATASDGSGAKGGEGSSSSDSIAPVSRQEGQTLGALPVDPSKESFYGWLDVDGDRYVTADTVVTGPMTLRSIGSQPIDESAAGVTVSAPIGAFPEGTSFEAREVSADELVSALGSREENSVVAAEITFHDTNRSAAPAVQPREAVLVTMDITGLDASSLVVYHIDDTGAVTAVSDFTVSENALSFYADTFSIYAVTEPPETQVDTFVFYKVTYNYIENSPQDTLIRTQTVKAGDILYDPATPASSGGSEFLGWFYRQSDDTEVRIPFVNGEWQISDTYVPTGATYRVYLKWGRRHYAYFYDMPYGSTDPEPKLLASYSVAQYQPLDFSELAADPETVSKVFDHWRAVWTSGDNTYTCDIASPLTPTIVDNQFAWKNGNSADNYLVKAGNNLAIMVLGKLCHRWYRR